MTKARSALLTPAKSAAEGGAPATWGRLRRAYAGSLLVAWVVAMVAVVVTGARHAPYADLERDLASGEVESVSTMGRLELGSGATGYTTTEVRWRAGVVTRWTYVVEATSKKQAQLARREGSRTAEVMVGNAAERWRELRPGLEVVRSPHRSTGSFNPGKHEWRFPASVMWSALLIGFLALAHVSRGPQPWRMTRWAWAWLILLAPVVGVPAYLLLSGPLGLAPPRRAGRVTALGGIVTALMLGVLGSLLLTWF